MEQSSSFLAQERMQKSVASLYSQIHLVIQTRQYSTFVILDKESHSEFSLGGLIKLPRGVSSLCSGQPWLLYWNLNALNVMGYEIPELLKSQIVAFLKECIDPKTHLLCGGPYQLPHLAPTYASLSALISIDTEEGYSIIDRRAIHDFILSMKKPDQPGAFTMHEFGESDMRSTYCAICTASVLNILDDEIRADVGNHIARCQGFDGGFSAEPFGESHGGYTYCAIASLVMLEETYKVDLEKALEWCLNRQMDYEGGFNGRPNKIVDSCYTFWIGASIILLKKELKIPEKVLLCDPQALQAYVMIAAQSPMGMFDKPGSSPDYYHTAYSLAGLSFFQEPKLFKEVELNLQEIDPLVNTLKKNTENARRFFSQQIKF